MKNLIMLMALLIPGVALAQEADETNAAKQARGMIFVTNENGSVQPVYPTPQLAQEALDDIRTEKGWGAGTAKVLLRQIGRPLPAAELDALADALARLILESSSRKVAYDALTVLRWAAYEGTSGSEIPYVRGLDLLIQVYEALDGTEAVDAEDLWYAIIGAGGEDYVMNLFASSERPEAPCSIQPYTPNITYWAGSGQEPVQEPAGPPPGGWCPNVSQWCELGFALGISKVEGVDLKHVLSICNKSLKVEDGKLQLGIYW